MLKLIIIFLLIQKSITFNPTILIHGIASNKNELNDMYLFLKKQNIDTYNIEVGNGKIDSIIMNMNKQCEIFANNINNLNITEKINIIGISQGGLLARCYVEKYSKNNVNSLITLGTPHMGYYESSLSFNNLDYWKDPFDYNKYLKSNTFLAYLNNDIYHDNYNLYKSNMENINNFILIWSNIDTVIKPLESSMFEFYNIYIAEKEKKLVIQNLNKSDVYKNIGLDKINLLIKQYDCPHNEFKKLDCFSNIYNNIYEYLKR